MDLAKKWNEHLRRESRKLRPEAEIACPLCGYEIRHRQQQHQQQQQQQQNQQQQQQQQQPVGAEPALFALFETHLADAHGPLLHEKATAEEKADWIRSQWEAAQPRNDRTAAAAEGRRAVCRSPAQPEEACRPGPSGSRRRGQPRSSSSQESHPSVKREGSRDRSVSPPKRSKARGTPAAEEGWADFDRGSYQKGRLWSPDEDAAAAPRPRPYDRSNVASYQRQRVLSPSQPKSSSSSSSSSHRPPQPPPPPPPPADAQPTPLIKQPETRPISQEQLIAEVKGIYAGLVMVESKCIEVDNAHSARNDLANRLNNLNNEQWQALIALHRTLLNEHHDFFLASQHPSANPALRRLAAKYAMPARMWRHGIHSFLELLRHRLPASLDHMLTFIYLSYSMMALLYETVPAFEDTWIECLGDLSRYRMAIEDEDEQDREVWTDVSRHWYSKASDKSPTTGRLYHHLAILARPNVLQQLYYYTKSLCVEMPFVSARESIMTLFEPVLAPAANPQRSRLLPTEFAFLKTHAILFTGKKQEELAEAKAEYLRFLDGHIARSSRRWVEPGYLTALSNICAVLEYGKEKNPIAKALRQARSGGASSPGDSVPQDNGAEPPSPSMEEALSLFNGTYDIVSRRFGDPNILSFLHVTLVFVYHLTFYPDAMAYVSPAFPWKLTALMLNTLIGSCRSHARIEDEQFPKTESAATRPLPDDYAQRGFPWVDRYFPDGWFTRADVDDDDKYFEIPSMTEERKERVLWLGCRIAAARDGEWLRYDAEARQFAVAPRYDVDLDGLDMPATPADSTDLGQLPDAANVT